MKILFYLGVFIVVQLSLATWCWVPCPMAFNYKGSPLECFLWWDATLVLISAYVACAYINIYGVFDDK